MSKDDEQARRNSAEREAKLAAAGAAGVSVAHELRNGLATASSSVFLARRDVNDRGKLLAHLEKIDREIHRAQKTIDAVIALARGDGLACEPVSIRAVVGAAVRALAPPPGVAVTVAVNPPEIEAACNSVLVERVLFNLLGNALEALEGRGQGQVTVRASEEEGWISLIVEDDGPGVDPALGDSIFDPLITTKPAGTGVGLALCRAIARAHGGEISVGPSELGGARFELRIPAG